MPPRRIEIQNPLVIMFKGPDGEIITHLHPDEHTYDEYGLLVCDLVRHIARAFKVDEDDVWEYVDKERARPTTGITTPS
jgi:hypothetical protein